MYMIVRGPRDFPWLWFVCLAGSSIVRWSGELEVAMMRERQNETLELNSVAVTRGGGWGCNPEGMSGWGSPHKQRMR